MSNKLLYKRKRGINKMKVQLNEQQIRRANKGVISTLTCVYFFLLCALYHMTLKYGFDVYALGMGIGIIVPAAINYVMYFKAPGSEKIIRLIAINWGITFLLLSVFCRYEPAGMGAAMLVALLAYYNLTIINIGIATYLLGMILYLVLDIARQGGIGQAYLPQYSYGYDNCRTTN